MDVLEDTDVLDQSVILDTAGDIYSKFILQCDQCGHNLTVHGVQEEPEVGIVMSVEACHNCTQKAHWNGYQEGRDEHQGI